MTLTQLRAFVATMGSGTFTAAAEDLGVSQASVSELIVRLECELDALLFVRGARRLVPTSAADELLVHARRTLQSADDAVVAMRSLTSLETGVATFGAMRNANYYGLSNLVREFHEQHPGVRIRMVGLNSFGVAESVAGGELEAGLVVLPVPFEGLRYEPLVSDDVLLACSGPGPGAGQARIQDLVTSGMILYDAHSGWNDPTRRQLLARAQAEGVQMTPLIEVEQAETALSLVAAGAGATIISDSIVRSGRVPHGVQTFPFAEPFEETLALVTRHDVPVSRATRKIMDLIRQSITGPRTHRP